MWSTDCPFYDFVALTGLSFNQRTCHILQIRLVSFIVLTIIFGVDGTIPNLAAIATAVSILACTWGTCQFFLYYRALALYIDENHSVTTK